MRSLHRLHKPAPRFISAAPLLFVLLPFACGIAVGEGLYAFLRGQTAWFFLGAALTIVLALLLRRHKLPVAASRLTYIALVITSTLVGVAMLVTEREASEVMWSGEESTVRVMVTDNPKSTARSIQVTVQILSGENAGRTVRLRLAKPYDKSESKAAPEVGDVMLCRTTIEAPRNSGNPGEFDYATWLRRNGVVGTGFCSATAWQVTNDSTVSLPLKVKVLRWRNELVHHYADYFKGRDLGVLAALTLGDKSHLDRETRSLYSEGGVSHVLALSGLHLSILFAIYQLFAFRLTRSYRKRMVMNLFGVVWLWLFALLAGMPLSLLRAAIMFTVMQVCGALHRSSFSLGTLTLAAFLLLFVSPSSLFDIGLQLSFLSVLAIVLFASYFPRPRWMKRKDKFERELEMEMAFVPSMSEREFKWWQRKHKLKERLRKTAVSIRGIVSVSLTAQLATAPLVAYYFHTFSVYGLVANLVIVPLVYPLLAAAFVFLALPLVRGMLAVAMSFILQLMDGCLTMVTSWPGAVLKFYPDLLTTALLLLVFTLVAYGLCHPSHRKRLRLFVTAVLTLGVAMGWDAYRHRASAITPQIVVVNTFDRPIVHFVSNAQRSFLWLPASGAATDSLANSSFCRDLWASRGMTMPEAFADTISRRELAVFRGVANFCGQRIAVVVDTCSRAIPQNPVPVDFLLLAGRLHAYPATVLRRYRPRTLVLSASLSRRARQRYTEAARSLDMPVYDLQSRGALFIPIGTAKP